MGKRKHKESFTTYGRKKRCSLSSAVLTSWGMAVFGGMKEQNESKLEEKVLKFDVPTVYLETAAVIGWVIVKPG